MKKISIMACLILLSGLAAVSSATSPMPEGVKPGMGATLCTIQITSVKDRERDTYEKLTSTFAFEGYPRPTNSDI